MVRRFAGITNLNPPLTGAPDGRAEMMAMRAKGAHGDQVPAYVVHGLAPAIPAVDVLHGITCRHGAVSLSPVDDTAGGQPGAIPAIRTATSGSLCVSLGADAPGCTRAVGQRESGD